MKREKEAIDVSIIVPVYNHEKYIWQALTSIVTQETMYTYEILIGEDASSDGSKDIIKNFEQENPERVHAFYREKNLGGTKNGYSLCIKASGRYIIVLEGDDYWTDKDKIQKQVSFLDNHLEYIGVASNFSVVDKDGKIIKEKSIPDEHLNKVFTWKDFLRRGFEFQTATFMYRNFFLDGKDYSILYKAHELVGDLTILTILLNRGNIFILDDVMSAYRMVIDEKASDACSIASRDGAVSAIKTVRQYIMLKPYLKNKKDFIFRISTVKMSFIVGMIRHKKGYTWKRWRELQHLGGSYTNLLIIVVFLQRCAQKCFVKIKRAER